MLKSIALKYFSTGQEIYQEIVYQALRLSFFHHIWSNDQYLEKQSNHQL